MTRPDQLNSRKLQSSSLSSIVVALCLVWLCRQRTCTARGYDMRILPIR
jgi:hypothetical protein